MDIRLRLGMFYGAVVDYARNVFSIKTYLPNTGRISKEDMRVVSEELERLCCDVSRRAQRVKSTRFIGRR